MRLDDNDFDLLGIAPRFAIDRRALDNRWLELQAEVHPDRFAADGAQSQRLAMQWAVRVNEAYQRLKDPLKRAAYLCSLNGVSIDAETNTAMPSAFLMQQLEWRESLDRAADAADTAAVGAIGAEVRKHKQGAIAELQATLDDRGDFSTAAAQVRALMFVERFAYDIDRRLEALGQ